MYDYDAEHALEITVGDMKVAWTDDDEVYVYAEQTKQQPTREDGYILIGRLEWVDSEGDSHDGNMQYNIERLRNFVWDYLK